MTNKRLFTIIFLIAIVGLLGSMNIFYQQFVQTEDKKDYNLATLKNQLVASEEQLKVITDENSTLRTEIISLKGDLDELYLQLSELNLAEEDLYNKAKKPSRKS